MTMIDTQKTQPQLKGQSPQTSQLVVPDSPSPIEKPSAWLREGTTPTEIILAIAILTSATIAGITGVIVAITGLVKKQSNS